MTRKPFHRQRRPSRSCIPVVPFPTTRDCAALYFPEPNPLVPLDFIAEGSGTPAPKSVVIRLEPATTGKEGERDTSDALTNV